ncbi:hypothetical protein GJ744_010095 [Endocarpon pusillum]|uniref:Uncharacterized protein n=1 Tax=Endocarpon pusillum TaxID=364733 RepID=A0A8H7AGQ9_9EURO|nr:hypothetical protein GJ744_010095 [Endocarpon pusillum]
MAVHYFSRTRNFFCLTIETSSLQELTGKARRKPRQHQKYLWLCCDRSWCLLTSLAASEELSVSAVVVGALSLIL